MERTRAPNERGQVGQKDHRVDAQRRDNVSRSTPLDVDGDSKEWMGTTWEGQQATASCGEVMLRPSPSRGPITAIHYHDEDIAKFHFQKGNAISAASTLSHSNLNQDVVELCMTIVLCILLVHC